MATDFIEQREGNFLVLGSRVSLDSIVYGFLNGESPETIRDNFSTLSLEQVYGSIAYYLGHQAVIDSYLNAKNEAYTGALQAQTHVPGDLRDRLGAPRAERLQL